MVLFLTSSPCDEAPEGVNLPFVLKEENEFLENIRKYYREETNGLMICADPYAHEFNSRIQKEYQEVFAYHGLVYREMFMCDSRNQDKIDEMLKRSSFIILVGGHVPTQNAFLKRINLPEKIKTFDGVIMGISAGSMNMANVVYALPENPGESVDPNYERFPTGLGLTDINVCPHYQMVKDWILDGRKLFEEIVFDDSHGRKFHTFVDGSYAVVEEGKAVLYGEIQEIKDGMMRKICETGQKIELRDKKDCD